MKIFATLLAALFLAFLVSGAPAPVPAAPAAAPAEAPPIPLDVLLEPVGSVGIKGTCIYNRADMSPEALAKSPVMLHLTIKSTQAAATSATVSLKAEDMFGKAVVIDGETQLAVPLQKSEGQKDIVFKAPGPGYYLIYATVQVGADTALASADFGLVLPPYPGVRPNSQFSTTGGEASDDKLDLFQAIGLRINRCTFMASLGSLKGLPPGQVPPLEFTNLDEKFNRYKSRGLWIFPVTNYTLGANDEIAPLAKATGQYGPPADEVRYAKVHAAVYQHYPEMKAAEFYNEPWIYGYGFGGSPADYDRFQKTFCEAVLKARPDFRIIAGNSSAFVIDNIEPNPSCWKGLLSGVSDHPYTKDDGDISWRSGANVRAYDANAETARRMGLAYAYVTEAATQYPGLFSQEKVKMTQALYAIYPQLQGLDQQITAAARHSKAFVKSTVKTSDMKADHKETMTLENNLKAEREKYPSVEDNIQNAAKGVQMNVRAGIEGLFQGCGGASHTRGSTTYAVLTHFIEDRPAVADIWPSNEMIWGGIFANPKFVTPEVRALPRAKEISVRWGVEIPKERQDDKTKVAIIWSVTGTSNSKLDPDGTLTIAKADGLTAYDMTGRVIPAGPDGLTVPFCNNPVYITSDALSVMELRDRIAHGVIKNVTPVNMYAFSLLDDPAQPQKLSVRVENQLNVPVKGTLHLKVAGTSGETSAPISIEASKLAEVAAPWPSGVAVNANNQYAITLSAEVASEATPTLPVTVTRQQVAAMARFVKKTIAINGSVDDWKGITPVVLDSGLLNQDIDESQYVLHPEVPIPTDNPKEQRRQIRVYTAYDQNNVYLAAAFNEDTFKIKVGEPLANGAHSLRSAPVPLPYPSQSGLPDGLHLPMDGDCIEFSFGFRDRVPGWGRQMDDPYAWKGDFYDVDYSYFANPSLDGDMLTRIWDADTYRGEGYQLAKVPGQGIIALGTSYAREGTPKVAASGGTSDNMKEATPSIPMKDIVPNARIRITRNEDTKLTLYEIVIPRSELKLFDPEKGRCRFGFIAYPGDRAKGSGGLSWSDAAGVFDHWQTMESFLPTYGTHTACQTFFGIEK